MTNPIQLLKNVRGEVLNYVIISFSLLVSTFASVLILKKKNNKFWSKLSAICLNILILVVATWISYSMNKEAQVFGIGHSDLYILIFAIPIITWINLLILQFVNSTNKNDC